MNRQHRRLGLLLTLPLLLAGCGSTHGADAAATGAAKPSASASMSSGMSGMKGMKGDMKGMDMSGTTHSSSPSSGKSTATATAESAAAAKPSPAAEMICGSETADAVATIAGLSAPAHKVRTWADGRLTCTYHLPTGALVLSVQEATDPATGQAHFADLKRRLAPTTTLTGLAALGLPAFRAGDGSAVFLKDGMTLRVDPSALPAHVGAEHTSRSDFAYTIATDVLACWSGDEH